MRFKVKNKRGVSPIVATILIILITFVAAVVIARFIVPLVSENLEESTECVDVSDYFYFETEFGYNCYDPVRDSNNDVIRRLYGVSIGAQGSGENLEQEIKGFRIAFANEQGSKALSVEIGEPVNRDDGGIRMLDESKNIFELPAIGEVRTYVYNTTEVFNSVRVHSILKNNRICDQSDSISLRGEICENDL